MPGPRKIAVLLLGLALAVGVSPAFAHRAHHHPPAPTLRAARVIDGSVILFRGHARKAHHHRVVLQQRRHHRWHRLKRIRVRHDRFHTRVRQTTRRGTYRVVTGGRASRPVRMAFQSRPASARRSVASSSTSATAPAAPSDACGTRPRKAGGGYWSCTFDDEFGGSTLDRSKWIPQVYFASGDLDGTYTCYRDDPANVDVGGGALHLTLRKVAEPVDCGVSDEPTHYVSGGVSTWHLFSQQYGRFEARIRVTAANVQGLHEAFWMWPDDRFPEGQGTWPDNGEIDVAEQWSSNPDVAVSTVHDQADHQGVLWGVNTQPCAAKRGVWNTYTLVWSADRITTYVNGEKCLVNTSGDPAFKKRYIVNLTQGLGQGPHGWVPDTPIPATTDVDYVRVWK